MNSTLLKKLVFPLSGDTVLDLFLMSCPDGITNTDYQEKAITQLFMLQWLSILKNG